MTITEPASSACQAQGTIGSCTYLGTELILTPYGGTPPTPCLLAHQTDANPPFPSSLLSPRTPGLPMEHSSYVGRNMEVSSLSTPTTHTSSAGIVLLASCKGMGLGKFGSREQYRRSRFSPQGRKSTPQWPYSVPTQAPLTPTYPTREEACNCWCQWCRTSRGAITTTPEDSSFSPSTIPDAISAAPPVTQPTTPRPGFVT